MLNFDTRRLREGLRAWSPALIAMVVGLVMFGLIFGDNLTITFNNPEARAPGGDDPRLLGVGLQTLRILR